MLGILYDWSPVTVYHYFDCPILPVQQLRSGAGTRVLLVQLVHLVVPESTVQVLQPDIAVPQAILE